MCGVLGHTTSPTFIATTMGGGLPQLTTGFCDEIVSSADSKDPGWPTSPTLQILQTKAIENGGRTYWRAVVSDGVHTTQAMVVTQLNSLLENGEVGEGSIILVQQFVINTIQNRP